MNIYSGTSKGVLEKLAGRLAGQLGLWRSPLGGFTACGYLKEYQRLCAAYYVNLNHTSKHATR